MKAAAAALIFACVVILVLTRRYMASAAGKAAGEYTSNITLMIFRASGEINKSEITKVTAITAAFFLALFLLTLNPIVLLLGVPACLLVPKTYIKRKEAAYTARYMEDLPGFIDLLISNLRAGLSITRAMQAIGEKDKGPVGNEMRLITKKTGLGRPVKEALSELSARVPGRENEIMVYALTTALDTGGNIAEVLEGISATIRKREEIKREVKSLTSQGVLSGIIIGALPFFLAGAVMMIDPEFMKPMFETTIGKMLIIVALCMEALGAFFISRITAVKS